MRVIRHLVHQPQRIGPVVLTLGNFDGVHRGHQAIIREAITRARSIGAQPAALTFSPHPLAVLAPARAPALIQPLHDRLAMLRALGLRLTILQRFTPAFAALEPEAFVRSFLLEHLVLAQVVVGYNLNFGHNRAGSADTLRALGGRFGFGVDVVGPVVADGGRVSSSLVREALRRGDMSRARALLGRPYAIRGRVVGGDRRGRTVGYPTANLHLRPGLLLPRDGVYAVGVDVGGQRRVGVLNIGVRPTFGGGRHTIETHILDFSGDLYRRWLTVHLIARLRDEVAFAGPEALRAAIAADVEAARRALRGAAVAASGGE